jgi:hypothetical protein
MTGYPSKTPVHGPAAHPARISGKTPLHRALAGYPEKRPYNAFCLDIWQRFWPKSAFFVPDIHKNAIVDHFAWISGIVI